MRVDEIVQNLKLKYLRCSLPPILYELEPSKYYDNYESFLTFRKFIARLIVVLKEHTKHATIFVKVFLKLEIYLCKSIRICPFFLTVLNTALIGSALYQLKSFKMVLVQLCSFALI